MATTKRRKRDSRTKAHFINFKAQLVKRGLCRQCGKKRDKRSPSKVRCSRCAKAHAIYMVKFRHRAATASTKGKAKVTKRETTKKAEPLLRKRAKALRAKVRRTVKAKARTKTHAKPKARAKAKAKPRATVTPIRERRKVAKVDIFDANERQADGIPA